MSSTNTSTMGDSSSMEMDTNQASTMDFHAGVGDTLWFQHFVPSTPATMFGACILLFFVAILSRLIDSFSRLMIMKWAKEADNTFERSTSNNTKRTPFILSNDLCRGILYLVQAGFSYLLMLAVMTYNGYFFISVLIGLGVGESCFGRFSRSGKRQTEEEQSKHNRSPSQEYPLLDKPDRVENQSSSILMKREINASSGGTEDSFA